jgi:uncharacterized membrane protein YdcZ (DUF606 family)
MSIAVQVTLSSQAGQVIGPLRTGFWLHMTGAGVSLVVIGLAALTRFDELSAWQPTGAVFAYVLAGGVLGIGIVAGASYAVPRVGIVAGQATIIFGQMLVAVVIDSVGLGVLEAITLEPRRVLGLAVLALAIWLLLPGQ